MISLLQRGRWTWAHRTCVTAAPPAADPRQLGVPPERARGKPERSPQRYSCPAAGSPQTLTPSHRAPLPEVAQYFKRVNKLQLDWAGCYVVGPAQAKRSQKGSQHQLQKVFHRKERNSLIWYELFQVLPTLRLI